MRSINMNTVHSIALTSWAVASTILLTITFAGWGFLVARSLRWRPLPDWGTLAALGMATLCVVGGFLNLLSAISVVTMWTLIVMGWFGAMTHGVVSRGPVRRRVVEGLALAPPPGPRSCRVDRRSDSPWCDHPGCWVRGRASRASDQDPAPGHFD